MSAIHPISLTAHEQARRRAALRDALAQVRLEGLEPHPLFFEYADRFARGEITLEAAITDFINSQPLSGR